ncbi:MAG: ATP-binding protein [Schwartzia succinivorans]|nr:ATP-binding protein [Schwartzia succinivorans]
MLIQFNFKNFKSFRDEATLDLSATNIDAFSDRVVKLGNEKLLTVAAIYGANASGKSNVYAAFDYMSNYVVQSFMFGDGNEDQDLQSKLTPFLFDAQSLDAESSFEIYFTLPLDDSGKVYNYGFSLNKNGIVEEWFNSKAKTAKISRTIFYRNTTENELDLSGIPDHSKENIKVALEKQVLIASLGAKLKVEKCKTIRDWFLANELADFSDFYFNFFNNNLPNNFIEDKKVQKQVINYLASFDGHIKDFKIEKLPNVDNQEKAGPYRIRSLHQMIGSDKMAALPLHDESKGTLKMFRLYPFIQKVMEKGSIFIVDELNAGLHPLLIRNFILTFLNPEINKNHAQLIFTTHDTWHLSNNLLREDEIWFVEKDDDGISSLYSLADFKEDVGNSSNIDYEELYLTGRYGAIPKLKLMKFLGGTTNG